MSSREIIIFRARGLKERLCQGSFSWEKGPNALLALTGKFHLEHSDLVWFPSGKAAHEMALLLLPRISSNAIINNIRKNHMSK